VNRQKVLIVEDSTSSCEHLTNLVKNIGFQAYPVEDKTEFLTTLHSQNPDLLLLGPTLRLGQKRAFVEIVGCKKEALPILCIGNREDTEQWASIRVTGNISSLPIHFDGHDLKRAIDRLTEESQDLDYKDLDNIIIGQTPAMVEIKRNILLVGKCDLTVLITGESGTGKEVVARAIHKFSPRADKAFVKVNCAALPTNLLESELFGFEKGAFTGAFVRKPGKFELAHTGSILLDEISEIPLPIQAKLLQVLQDNSFSSLGSTTDTRINARVLAATNKNLSEMVSQGRLRSDFYWRLKVVSIHVPPLRDRKQDLDLLCRHFLKKYADRYGREYVPVSDHIPEQLYEYAWPGNVRELENVIQKVAALGDEKCLYTEMGKYTPDSPFLHSKGRFTQWKAGSIGAFRSSATQSLKKACKEAARKAETEAIMRVLLHTHWNRKKAAAILKVSYKTLLNKMREYQIMTEYSGFHRPHQSGTWKPQFPLSERWLWSQQR